MQQRETREHQPAQAAQFFCPRCPRAALVLDNTRQVEEIHGRCVGMHFDLKSASFPGTHFRAVAEAQVREPPTERQDVLSKRAAEVGGMAPGVEAAKVAVHFAFSVADSRWVADHQRSVDCDDSTAISGLALDPTPESRPNFPGESHFVDTDRYF
jgi:hypothetical protein